MCVEYFVAGDYFSLWLPDSIRGQYSQPDGEHRLCKTLLEVTNDREVRIVSEWNNQFMNHKSEDT
jgi:hypothetical protein